MLDCIFCKIVRGELPSYKVYEDEKTLSFLDINPVSPGHVLVVPKEHSNNIFEISPEAWGYVQETARKVAQALEKGLGADGINVMMNNREHAGQVVGHTHVHLIPRYKGDGLKLWPHRPLKDGEGEEVVEKIRAEL
jgi:histidine triad (HIT) family protein